MRRSRGIGGGARRAGGTAKLYRINQTRKVTRRPDKRGMQLRRLRENKYKNARRQGGRSGGARAARRMDHYHMRRRYLHAGLAGGALGAGMFEGEEMDENAYMDDAFLDDSLLDEFGEEVTDEETDDYTEGSESEISEGEEEEALDGPPLLESDEHSHVFIFHSSNKEDKTQAEHYAAVIENPPHDLKVISNDKDFKQELSPIENITNAMSMSLYTVAFVTPDFIREHLENLEQSLPNAYPDENQRKNRLIVVIGHEVKSLPPALQDYHHILSLTNTECFEILTKQLMTVPLAIGNGVGGKGKGQTEPSAPELGSDGSPTHTKDNENTTAQELKEPTTVYPNGFVVKRVTACKYSDFEAKDEEMGLCETYCPRSDIFCPKPEPSYKVPHGLTKRGLQVTVDEVTEILHSLTESSNVTFFQKAVDCSPPCLFLSTVMACSLVSILMWFLVVGGLSRYRAGEEISGSIFWSFIILVFFIPGIVALIMLGVVLHLVNYKFIKYRIKIEELNKRLRETNLVLHVRKGYWVCSGKFKLCFIYYNFEDCQQTLYCHVHDSMKSPNGAQTPESEKLLNDSSTVKLDRIMKRVNTLTKKFEWDYFEALSTNKLPQVQEKEHRKKGMCFCQYVLHREDKAAPMSIVEHVKGHMGSMRNNAFKKSHKRRSNRPSLPYYKSPTFESTIANV